MVDIVAAVAEDAVMVEVPVGGIDANGDRLFLDSSFQLVSGGRNINYSVDVEFSSHHLAGLINSSVGVVVLESNSVVPDPA